MLKWFSVFPFSCYPFFLLYKLYTFICKKLEEFGHYLAEPPVKMAIAKEEKQLNNKYKNMLSEAIVALEKYNNNLSKTSLTVEGKGIVTSVKASIESLRRIINRATEDRITVDVFEKAYKAIKANRTELQRAEKLVSLGLEDQLEQEVKLMRATLPK
jgi:hypothetical protein